MKAPAQVYLQKADEVLAEIKRLEKSLMEASAPLSDIQYAKRKLDKLRSNYAKLLAKANAAKQ
jgi:hypothetical protein